MSTKKKRIKHYIFSEKLNITSFIDEFRILLNEQIINTIIKYNFFINNIIDLFHYLLHENLVYLNEFYLFNRKENSYEFKAYYILSLIIFSNRIFFIYNIRKFTIIDDKFKNLLFHILLIDILVILCNIIKSKKERINYYYFKRNALKKEDLLFCKNGLFEVKCLSANTCETSYRKNNYLDNIDKVINSGNKRTKFLYLNKNLPRYIFY